MNCKLPLHLTPDCEIVDSDDKVICPTMWYRSDANHINSQKAIGKEIVDIVNRANGYVLVLQEDEDGKVEERYFLKDEVENQVEDTDTDESIGAEPVGSVIKKPRGRPRKSLV